MSNLEIILTSISLLLAFLGIALSYRIFVISSLKHWKKKLGKRLRFIEKYDEGSLDVITIKNDGEKPWEKKGFLLITHAYWGYYRKGSSYTYGFIIPFIQTSFTEDKYNNNLYVWIAHDSNIQDESGEISMKNSDLEEMSLVGKAGQNITEEILGSVERVKIIYNWYRYYEQNAKYNKQDESKQKKLNYPNH